MKFFNYFSIIFISLGIFTLCAKQEVYVIIHGTYAQNGTWHKPGSKFFNEIEQQCKGKNNKVISFTWSGKNSHDARIEGAKKLAKVINNYPQNTYFHIIAHSHGGNVGILASQLLQNKKPKHKIKTFFALGTPINPVLYAPNMDTIFHLYNFFSFNDAVQPVLGYFNRELPKHERIFNIRITINGSQPDHYEIAHHSFGKWIPNFENQLNAYIKKFPYFAQVPLMIDYNENNSLTFHVDLAKELFKKQDYKNHSWRAALKILYDHVWKPTKNRLFNTDTPVFNFYNSLHERMSTWLDKPKSSVIS